MNLFVILVINVSMFFIVTTLLYIPAYLPIPGQCTDFVINVFLVTVYFMVPYCIVHLYLPPGVPGLLEGAGDPLPPELSHCPCRESFMALVASCCLANCSSAILLALSSYFSLSSLFKFLHCENTSVSQTNDLSDPLPVQQIIYLIVYLLLTWLLVIKSK